MTINFILILKQLLLLRYSLGIHIIIIIIDTIVHSFHLVDFGDSR